MDKVPTALVNPLRLFEAAKIPMKESDDVQREYQEDFFSEQEEYIKRRDGSKQTKAASMATKPQLIF